MLYSRYACAAVIAFLLGEVTAAPASLHLPNTGNVAAPQTPVKATEEAKYAHRGHTVPHQRGFYQLKASIHGIPQNHAATMQMIRRTLTSEQQIMVHTVAAEAHIHAHAGARAQAANLRQQAALFHPHEPEHHELHAKAQQKDAEAVEAGKKATYHIVMALHHGSK